MSLPRRLIPTLASLRALEAVARLGSASAAAADQDLTQGAISRQLKVLEDQLGVQLVVREGKTLKVLPDAIEYAAEVRLALERLAQATMRLQARPVDGTLNLAILPAFGMRWLMPLLPEFAKKHPEVTVNMATRLRPFDFATEGFDAALHFGTADWPGADALLLRHEEMIPVCTPALARRVDLVSGPGLSAQDLPLLHIQSRPKAWREWFQKLGLEPAADLGGMTYDQFSTISQAALHGLGVALMPSYLVEEDLALGRLVALYPEPVDIGGAYYLVWPRAKSADPGVRALRDWLASRSQAEDPLPR